MMRVRTWLVLGVVAACLSNSGGNPFAMGFATPIPVQPWMADQVEAKMNNPSDANTVIMPPIPPGYRPLCEDPPDRATIVRAMPAVVRGVPYVWEEHRDEYDFVVERLVDSIDPPRFFPLIGPAQLHHCHYKCTIYYTETIQSSYPFSFKCTRRRTEVVYIDRDHLHQCVPSPETRQSVTRDLTTRP